MTDGQIVLYMIIGFIVSIFIFAWLHYSKIEKKIRKLFAEQDNFNSTHVYVSSINSSAIAIDTDSKQILFYENKKILKINFDELISIETIINDQTIHKTERGSQIVGGAIGGLLLGPAGLLIGGLSGKKISTKKINKISIRATISNIDKPICDIVFHEGSTIKSGSSAHKVASELADEWIGRLTVIISSK